jgi:DNA-binding helix-hairpin-helix protein with protein kinase domain
MDPGPFSPLAGRCLPNRSFRRRQHPSASASERLALTGGKVVPTIGPAALETAWDVKSHSIKMVPEFGPVLTKKLMDWRRSFESRFKFNPNIPTDPAEIAKVRAEIAVRRSALEAELIKGGRDLETIRAEALANRGDASQYQVHYLAFRQAEADAAAF